MGCDCSHAWNGSSSGTHSTNGSYPASAAATVAAPSSSPCPGLPSSLASSVSCSQTGTMTRGRRCTPPPHATKRRHAARRLSSSGEALVVAPGHGDLKGRRSTAASCDTDSMRGSSALLHTSTSPLRVGGNRRLFTCNSYFTGDSYSPETATHLRQLFT
ncbi:unnamed protein product [Closterium sp. NIES-53]